MRTTRSSPPSKLLAIRSIFDAYTVGADGTSRIDSFAIEKKTADVPDSSTDVSKPDESTTAPVTTDTTKPEDTKQPDQTQTPDTDPAGDVTAPTTTAPEHTQTTAPTTAENAENPLTGDDTSALLIAVPVTALAALVLAETMRRKKTRGEQ